MQVYWNVRICFHAKKEIFFSHRITVVNQQDTNSLFWDTSCASLQSRENTVRLNNCFKERASDLARTHNIRETNLGYHSI